MIETEKSLDMLWVYLRSIYSSDSERGGWGVGGCFGDTLTQSSGHPN